MPAERYLKNPELVGVRDLRGSAMPLAAGQTFTKGAFVVISGGQVSEALNAANQYLALAAEDAAPGYQKWPVAKTDVSFHSLKGAEIAINVYTAAGNTPVIGNKYPITKQGGYWRINLDTTTGATMTVLRLFDSGASLSDPNVRVVCAIDDSACYVGPVQ
uniref:Uncharacterized protein n=1 Tax=Hot spring virus BHS2 TaxID=2024352 RepID=A0A2U7P6E5_9VIRU|nr:hypothetical protein [Hot spring virus BHS2]